jgi:hypothetical protein
MEDGVYPVPADERMGSRTLMPVLVPMYTVHHQKLRPIATGNGDMPSPVIFFESSVGCAGERRGEARP